MIKISKIYPRDIIALVCLIIIFILIAFGFDGWLQGVGAVIIGYYFSKRVYEEGNPNGDLSKRVEELEQPKTMTAKFNDAPASNRILSDEEKLKEFSGDFKPVSK